MSITIELPPDMDKALRERAVSTGKSPEEFAAYLVELHLRALMPPPQRPFEEWQKEFRAWLDSHKPTHHFVDDSRDSIYEGCGE